MSTGCRRARNGSGGEGHVKLSNGSEMAPRQFRSWGPGGLHKDQYTYMYVTYVRAAFETGNSRRFYAVAPVCQCLPHCVYLVCNIRLEVWDGPLPRYVNYTVVTSTRMTWRFYHSGEISTYPGLEISAKAIVMEIIALSKSEILVTQKKGHWKLKPPILVTSIFQSICIFFF